MRAAVLACVACLATSSVLAAHRPLMLDDRVEAQRAIEQVFWNHRIWPKDNPTAKPPLAAVMPDAALRAKVEDTLKKSNALATIWGHPVTPHDLQAELDRMARESRDRQTLRDLFAALGNDPYVVAETLARQTLVERLVRNRYAGDPRFQSAIRATAEAAVATCRDASCMKTMGGTYAETTVALGHDDPPSTDRTVRLDTTEWRDYLARLDAAVGTLEETPDAFAARAVLSRTADAVTTAVVSWPKRSFDDWWGSERTSLAPAAGVDDAPYTLPTLDAGACTNDTWASAQDRVPDRRYDHVAVWTGSEMIVWGGTDDDGLTSSGGRYDPATDTWTPTSIGPATPTPTYLGTAVWTGTWMIVWGGFNNENGVHDTNTGARYDPATDTWTPTSTGAGVPAARSGHTAVWTGSEMIVWGGGASGSLPFGDGGRYDPVSDSWTPVPAVANSPQGRSRHTAVWTGAAMIVWGGSNGFYATNTGGRYDPATGTWSPVSTGANVPAGRLEHLAVWTGSQMIVWGGHDLSGTELITGGRYDVATDSWQPTSTGYAAPPASADARAIWSGSRMIVFGGQAGGASAGAKIYDPVADTWANSADCPLGIRTHHTLVWTGTEMIVWGGKNGATPSNDGARYDPVTDTWTRTSLGVTLPAARERATAIWTGVEMIVWGGDATVFPPQQRLNTGDRYNPALDTWAPTSAGNGVPDPRDFHTAIWTGKEMIVWGGDIPAGGGSSVATNTGGRYDPITDSWAPTSTGESVPSARGGHLAVWTGREMIVFGGGTNTGGRYDPATDAWTPTSTGANAPPISGFLTPSAVWTGSRMIVWTGGFAAGGSYDPLTDAWTPVASGSGVVGTRYYHTAVWSGARMIVWGGTSASQSSVLDTGGLYDPATDSWTPTSTGAGVPEARYDHSAVWTGSEMIVWGGSTLQDLTDTGGRYDPATDSWTPTSVDANTPFPRYMHTAVWTGTQMIVWSAEPATPTGGLYCACPNGRLVYRDADGDGYGDPAISETSCDGSIPAGYVSDATDCNDASAAAHPGGVEVCDGLDNDCNGLVDEDASGEDSDGDGVHNLCDDCPFRFDPGQSDFDHDGQGDACDLDDGLIFVYGTDDPATIEWQPETGPTSWDVYTGDLDVLKSTGTYTQAPGSNPLADRFCDLASTSVADPGVPDPGKVKFSLVAGKQNGVEGSLGTDSDGLERPNANPCP